jgi:hypothetical protein
VKALGLTQEVAEALGVGHASKGLMRGFVAVPIRTKTGKLVGYMGVTQAKLPPSWKL